MTHSALERHAKGLFKTVAERREKYSELNALFAKEKDPDSKKGDKIAMANRIPIDNPQPVVIPSVTFDEHNQHQNCIHCSLMTRSSGRWRSRADCARCPIMAEAR